ncbi:MAG: histidine kinase [Candidatus Eisenbacteria bacterium]
MHPLLANRTMLGLYLLTWLGLGVGLAGQLTLLFRLPFTTSLVWAVPLAVAYGFVCLSAWWVARAQPLGDRPSLAAATAVVSASLQASVFLAGPGTAYGALLARFGGFDLNREVLLKGAVLLFVIGVPLYLVSAMVHYLFFALERSRTADRLALRTQVGAREAELRALRAQLDPHFLFNSLNSINALIGSDPEGARRMCEGLGDFMRQTLRLGSRKSVPLSEEIALVERYLAIEQVRFGERLQVERALEIPALECLVPPLLLQPLVENAIKHGVAGRIEGGTIRLRASRAEEKLWLEVENPVDADAAATPGEGVGLENVRRRLSATGAGDAQLDVVRSPGSFRVTLSLPAETTGKGAADVR